MPGAEEISSEWEAGFVTAHLLGQHIADLKF
jgi:hypothetical protein